MHLVDWEEAKRERAKGVTYKTLYKELVPAEISYWAFWKKLGALAVTPPETTMLLVHKPGERTQVDYSDGIDTVDPVTGEMTTTQLFVGVLPFIFNNIFADKMARCDVYLSFDFVARFKKKR